MLRREERADVVERSATGGGRHHRHIALRGQFERAALVAEQGKLLGRGADERDTCCRACLREVGTLAQKAVAGMDRIAASGARRAENGVDIEIGGRTIAG